MAEAQAATRERSTVDQAGKLFYRLPDLVRAVGLSKSTIYDLIDKGQFPRPRHITSKAVGWLPQDVVDWANNRPEA